MTTSEKVAYLKGLVEGYGLNGDTREGKLLAAALDILEDLALDVEELGSDVAELEEGLDAVSEDLEDVENLVYQEDGEDEDEEEEEDEASVFYEVECPSCGREITFEESVLKNGSMQCPGCGETLEFDLEDEDEPEQPEG